MADKYVRILGEVTDLDDVRVGIGVDYDAITIGQLRFSADQMEEVAQFVIAAVWQAGQQKTATRRPAMAADRTLGQVAYEKYAQVLGGGRTLLRWKDLRPPVRARWERIAKAVIEECGGGHG